MAETHYDIELEKLAETYAFALEADVSRIKAFIAGASESSVIGVGSGGSYTVPTVAGCHEALFKEHAHNGRMPFGCDAARQ